MSGSLQYCYNYGASKGLADASLKNTMSKSLAQLFWWTVTALQSPPRNALSLVLFFVPLDVEIDFLNAFWRMIDVESLIDESAHV